MKVLIRILIRSFAFFTALSAGDFIACLGGLTTQVYPSRINAPIVQAVSTTIRYTGTIKCEENNRYYFLPTLAFWYKVYISETPEIKKLCQDEQAIVFSGKVTKISDDEWESENYSWQKLE